MLLYAPFGKVLFLSVLLSGLFLPSSLPAQNANKPKLILQITVDQLRGDLPYRYYDRLGEGGFRYLLDEGVVFADAHHAHANTETIVGHTTLATGTYPAVHGMVGNIWYDRTSGKEVYNIEDPAYSLLTAGADVDDDTEIDPTQKVASSDGRSPNAILSSTFSDELSISTGGRAKVFGVSVKDRGAVSMAGHTGKAFWFSKASGEFVTSNYYYEQYPEWVTQWNQQKKPYRYADQNWELMHDRSTYLFGDADDKPWETGLPGFGRTFPHAYGPADNGYFTTFLTLSPAGDELTLDFAKTLVEEEQIGQDEVTDYLSVSFSSTDYVGHIFGPSSLESEDNILRLDRTLADLIAFIDQKVGLENTLIVLSADHGGPEAPGYLTERGLQADYIHPETWNKQPAMQALVEQFGVGKELIQGYSHPYVNLNRATIEAENLDFGTVERAVAKELALFPGVALAVSSRALNEGNLPATPLYEMVLNNFNADRSGDIYVVFEPHYFLNEFDGLTVAATHGSPWRYDTFVPIIFAGAGLSAEKVYRPVRTVDLSPTLSAYLGIKPPSGAVGQPLVEVLKK